MRGIDFMVVWTLLTIASATAVITGGCSQDTFFSSVYFSSISIVASYVYSKMFA